MTDLYSDNNVDQNANVTPPPAAAPQIPDEVAELVGPGKKYATIELALKALKPSQEHIARLEAEAVELKRKAEAAVSQDGMYEAVQELLKAQGKPPVAAGLDEATVASLVDRQLAAAQAQAVKSANVTAFKTVFEKTYGEKAKDAFNGKAAALGLTPAYLTALAETSPQAALELFGLKQAPTAGMKTQSSVNTEMFNHNQQTPPPKRNLISGGASRADLQSAWNETKKRVAEKYGESV